jgi:alkylation response protein AidB-like acyl-CoA dehydrogenase
MMLPEQFGGSELGATDCAVVFEELGPGPYPARSLPQGIFAAQMILRGATEEQKKSLLPQLCKAESIIVPGNHR